MNRRMTMLLAFLWGTSAIWCGAAAAAEPSIQQAAWEVLDAGLHDKSPDKRARAVTALGLMARDKKGIQEAENALNDKDPKVVRAAIGALGEMDSAASLPRIKPLISQPDGKTVLAAAAFLKKFRDPDGYEIYYEVLTGKRKDGGSIFDGLKDKKGIEVMGVEAAIGVLPFGGIGTGAYEYVMQNGSSHADASVAAAEAIAEDRDPLAKKALVQAVLMGKKPVQLAALRALAKRGDPSVVEEIRPALHSGQPLISYTAAAAVLHLAH